MGARCGRDTGSRWRRHSGRGREATIRMGDTGWRRWVVFPPRPAGPQREISIFEVLVRLRVLERKGVTGVKMLCTVTSTELPGSLWPVGVDEHASVGVHHVTVTSTGSPTVVLWT